MMPLAPCDVHSDAVSTTAATPVWRHRDLLVTAVARGVSALGNGLALVALLLHLQEKGLGGWGVSALLLADALPLVVLAPLAGVLVDRCDSRTLIVASSLWQTVVCLLLALVTPVPAILALVFLLGTGSVVTAPTLQSLVPRMVGEEQLNRANSLLQTTFTVAMVAGPTLGGLLYGRFGLRLPLFVDAASFLAITAAGVVVRTRRRVTADPAGVKPRLRDGVILLASDQLLAALTVLLVAFVFVGEVTNVVEVFLVRETLGNSALVYGLLGTTWVAGMLVGAVVAGRFEGERRLSRSVLVGCGLLGVIMLGVAAVPSVGWLFWLFALGGLGNGLINVCAGTLLTLRTPEAVRGRVFSAVNGVTRGAGVGALAAGGLLSSLFTPRQVFAGVGVAVLLVLLACWPALRSAAVPHQPLSVSKAASA